MFTIVHMFLWVVCDGVKWLETKSGYHAKESEKDVRGVQSAFIQKFLFRVD